MTADAGRDARIYPGTCRHRGIALTDDVAWRVRIDSGTETFDDALAGPRRQDPAHESGDIVIRDRRGNWTYQFCVVVDDLLQDVDLVIRGVDLLSSTGLQIHLARLLGRASAPRFAHHPLVMKTPNQKLSKSDRDTGIRERRNEGIAPAAVIGEAAHRVGLIDAPRPIAAHEVASLFRD
jgi:glutamyl/glutaminyl-tRNA synthetase